MQRKTAYYFRKLAATALAAATGLVVGILVEANNPALDRGASPYFVLQAYASDDFVQFGTQPSPFVNDAANRPDLARECGTGIALDCTYL